MKKGKAKAKMPMKGKMPPKKMPMTPKEMKAQKKKMMG